VPSLRIERCPPVTENAPRFAPGDFFDDAESLQIGERSVDRRGRGARLLNELDSRQVGILQKKTSWILLTLSDAAPQPTLGHVQVSASLPHYHATIPHKLHRLELELAAEYPASHSWTSDRAKTLT
jgi:hypothetical protein